MAARATRTVAAGRATVQTTKSKFIRCSLPLNFLIPNRDILKLSKAQMVAAAKPRAYTPPSGFEPALIDETPQISQLLSSPNLEEKEIWYITVPASVPLSSIENLSLQAIEKRENILSHNGDEYYFVPDSNEVEAAAKVMVPSSSKTGYHTSMHNGSHSFCNTKISGKTSISRILHIQQNMPQTKFTSEVTKPAIKPVRQQPSGLKMRFHPIGFEPESSSDLDMNDAPAAGFRKPESMSSSSESSNNEDAEVPHLKPRKKSKMPTAESSKANGRPNKRKHSEGENKKSKHSSFKSEPMTDHRKLKRANSQVKKKRITDNQSASIKIQPNPPPILPPKFPISTQILPPVRGATNSRA